MQGAEFIAEYGSVLRGLQRNDKTQINTLSMLAEANKTFAPGIVQTIEQHILTCPPPAKLPALYLVDSIIKNAGEPYKGLFSGHLPQVFGAVWDTTLQDKRSSLSRLFGTWTSVLPDSVLASVKERMVSSSSGGGGGQLAAQPQPQLVVQQQPQAAAAAAAYMQVGAAAYPAAVQYAAVPQQPQYVQYAVQQPQTAYMQVGGALVQVAALPQQAAAMWPPVQQQQPYQLQQPQHVMQTVGLPPVSPAHAWAQQQPPSGGGGGGGGGPGPMVRRSPGLPSPARPPEPQHYPGPPPPAAGAGKGASPSPATPPAELSGEALSRMLASLAAGGRPTRAAQAAAEAAGKVTEFAPSFLKEVQPGVLLQLERLSIKSRPRFRDAEFQRNKRRAAAAGGALSRAWFLPVDTWIAGTVAADEVVAASNPFGDDDAAAGTAAAEPPPPVEPEDPDQPCCAISGEPFDKFFDQEREGWFFRGAVRIRGAEAERYGVHDGALVKAKCLAEAALGSGAAALAAAAPGGGGGGTADDALLAAAAADAPAAGGAQPGANGQQQQQQQQLGPGVGIPEGAAEHKPAAVKQEVVLEELPADAKVEAAAGADSAAEQALQHAGAKREAAAAASAADACAGHEPGAAAKKARLEGQQA